jgi:hypothetical protein
VVIDHPTSGLPPICYHQVSAARAAGPGKILPREG